MCASFLASPSLGATELAEVRMSLLRMSRWHKRAAASVAVALALGICSTADAQTAEPESAATPAPAPVAPGTPAPSSAPATPSSGTVSPPDGPGATPSTAPADNVAKAKETAKVAELTPIVTSPANPLRPAFQLYTEVDLPVLGVGVVFASARLVRSQKSFCAPLCNRRDLNAFDRITAGFWSPAWATASDIGLYGIAAASATLLVADEGFLDALNDSVVIAESALSATALSSLITLAAGRPRPFLYGDKAPLRQRESPDAGLSFVSSHASVSFAIATSMFMTTRRLNPSSPVPGLVLAVGGALASFVATARVMGGQHFISDALGGALVGASVGILVPAMHSSPLRITPIVSDTERGLGVGGAF
jgi:membrane-associated phospholipid phosphatase